MCTVTFIARRNGFLLGMNRDEQRTRVRGLPAAEREYDGMRVLHPSEPSGGTWIAVSEAGLCLALINWYSVRNRPEAGAISRGLVVGQAISSGGLADVEQALVTLPLARINPFRLIGADAGALQLAEWRWDRRQLDCLVHPWRTRQWISSGFDEPGAEVSRSAVFQQHLRRADAGSQAWLRRLHRSHAPARGAYSPCVHRRDAVTVSYSEVRVSEKRVAMNHLDGSPCRARRKSGMARLQMPRRRDGR